CAREEVVGTTSTFDFW
nr:immunoglobulin heavy chain junction region [Macaca mulatta]MOX14536.1 immunoglobulin heavy chain junction region [Macaca mulatta]MOX14612.1 immunoglobulin heavy chain junction region [Macaca mulatta]MOX14617.1 immunoglobulin heavy chain junction region [Macaca mulatta]MOX14643.1 immunoglobulin heavy chain junction region [Macaca mulatta]